MTRVKAMLQWNNFVHGNRFVYRERQKNPFRRYNKLLIRMKRESGRHIRCGPSLPFHIPVYSAQWCVGTLSKRHTPVPFNRHSGVSTLLWHYCGQCRLQLRDRSDIVTARLSRKLRIFTALLHFRAIYLDLDLSSYSWRGVLTNRAVNGGHVTDTRTCCRCFT